MDGWKRLWRRLRRLLGQSRIRLSAAEVEALEAAKGRRSGWESSPATADGGPGATALVATSSPEDEFCSAHLAGSLERLEKIES